MATVTIANNATESDALNVGAIGQVVVGIVTPATLTGVAFTFKASVDGSTYVPVYDTSGSAYTVTVSTSRYIPLPPATFAGITYLKVVSGSTEGGSRIITVVTRPI